MDVLEELDGELKFELGPPEVVVLEDAGDDELEGEFKFALGPILLAGETGVPEDLAPLTGL